MYFKPLVPDLSPSPFYSESPKKADLECNNLGGVGEGVWGGEC